MGGLEKNGEAGGVSYLPDDHQMMVDLRAKKIASIEIDNGVELIGDKHADLLVVSWGSTYGAVREAVQQCEKEGRSIAMLHLRQVHPLSTAALKLIQSSANVVVCELNNGQLCHQIRAATLVDAKAITQVNGQPFQIQTLVTAFKEHYEHSKAV